MDYHIARNNQQLGQFDEATVRVKLSSGEFQPEDLCWTEGMAEWQALGKVMAQSEVVAAAPTYEANPYAPPTVQQTYREAVKPTGAPLATLGERLGAALLDGVIVAVGYLPLIMGSSSVDAEGNTTGEGSALLMGFGGLILLGLIIVNVVLLVKRGQTIGKRLVGIRIVDKDSDVNPGPVKTILLRAIVNGLIGLIPLYGLVDVLFIFGRERRCIHDLIAGTRVVQGQPGPG